MKHFSKKVLIAITLTAGLTTAAQAQVRCGDRIELNGDTVVLDRPLTCTTHPALTVVGPGQLDLAGRTIRCSSRGRYGLVVEGERAKVLGGQVTGCDTGIIVRGSRHTLDHLVVQANFTGINLGSSRQTQVRNSMAAGNFTGFGAGGTRNTFRDNTATGNSSGFTIGGNNQTFRDNTAMGNGVGFFVSLTGSGHRFQNNRATDNYRGFHSKLGGKNTFLKNFSVGNQDYDIQEDLSCGTNRWRSNTFGFTNKPECVE